MTHVIRAMGTVLSLTLEDEDEDEDVEENDERSAVSAVREVTDVFRAFERRFSLYRPDSELSRIARGEIGLPDADAELRDLYADALAWREATAGVFTPHRPDGMIDLNGIVKARATERASEALQRLGHESWTLAVGGDVLVAGRPRGRDSWSVGVVDPDDRTRLLATLHLDGSRRAVATSGSTERGDHIWVTAPGPRIIQATVIADDIETADVLATTLVAGGPDRVDEVTGRWDIDALVVDSSGGLRATPGMRRRLTDLDIRSQVAEEVFARAAGSDSLVPHHGDRQSGLTRSPGPERCSPPERGLTGL